MSNAVPQHPNTSEMCKFDIADPARLQSLFEQLRKFCAPHVISTGSIELGSNRYFNKSST